MDRNQNHRLEVELELNEIEMPIISFLIIKTISLYNNSYPSKCINNTQYIPGVQLLKPHGYKIVYNTVVLLNKHSVCVCVHTNMRRWPLHQLSPPFSHPQSLLKNSTVVLNDAKRRSTTMD